MVNKLIKLNIGSGTVIAPGWINYDISIKIWVLKHRFLKRLLYLLRIISKEDYEKEWPRNVIRRDARKGLPHPDNQ